MEGDGLADARDGVRRSYAIQAGREIRVIARHSEVDDAQSEMLAGVVAKRHEAGGGGHGENTERGIRGRGAPRVDGKGACRGRVYNSGRAV